ncbi:MULTISPECIES: transposase [unclassified Mesorhizobium]|uniref:transposase n=1 Tax=unclassified Mesorhizobium TaxID=325217 RepID=UPI0033381EDF
MLHGGNPDTRRGGRAAAEPRAGDPGRRADAAHQPHQGDPRPLRRPQLPAEPAQAADRLESIRTAEGTPLPDNTRAELYRFLERLNLVRAQIRAIEQERLRRLAAAPAAANGPHAMVRLLARIIGIGVETADMLVNEMLSRKLRDRRAVARYAGLTGSPDESGNTPRVG